MLGLAVGPHGDIVGQHREVIRDDQVVLFIRPCAVRHCARLWARSLFVIRDFRQGSCCCRRPMHQRTSPVIGRHGAVFLTALRLRAGLRHRIISRTGRPYEPSKPLETRGCFAPSRGRRGALEERRRPFGDPFRVKRPVSEGRMAPPTPFETKRKKAPIGALERIQHLNVAERQGFEPWRRFPAYTLSRRAPSTTRPPLRAIYLTLRGGLRKSEFGRARGEHRRWLCVGLFFPKPRMQLRGAEFGEGLKNLPTSA